MSVDPRLCPTLEGASLGTHKGLLQVCSGAPLPPLSLVSVTGILYMLPPWPETQETQLSFSKGMVIFSSEGCSGNKMG